MLYLLPFFIPDYQCQCKGEWGFVVACHDKEGEDSGFFDDMELLEQPDYEKFKNLLENISVLAKQGKPWESLFPDKKLHKLIGCDAKLKDGNKLIDKKVVWQFRSDEIRILWCYLEDKTILLAHVFTKRTDKTPKPAITRAHSTIRAYMQAHHDKSLKYLT